MIVAKPHQTIASTMEVIVHVRPVLLQIHAIRKVKLKKIMEEQREREHHNRLRLNIWK